MIDCEAMRDRMPDVAHAKAQWTGLEASHLAACADCAREWRIVRAGTMLGAGTTVVADRVAQSVTDRLRRAGPPADVVGWLPWRAGVSGLIAAAACVALILWLPRHDSARRAATGDSAAAMAMLPELQGLDDARLRSVLQSMGPSAADATPGVLPHLGDLTDSELEQLLRSEGGQ
jgi:hypothetical protein